MNIKCDWCSMFAEEPVATIHCAAFTLPDDGYVDDGEWATCSTCQQLFREGGFAALTERALSLHHGNHGFIRRMHAAVEAGFINIDYEHP